MSETFYLSWLIDWSWRFEVNDYKTGLPLNVQYMPVGVKNVCIQYVWAQQKLFITCALPCLSLCKTLQLQKKKTVDLS